MLIKSMIFEATTRRGDVVRVPKWLWGAVLAAFGYLTVTITAMAIAGFAWAWDQNAASAAHEQRLDGVERQSAE